MQFQHFFCPRAFSKSWLLPFLRVSEKKLIKTNYVWIITRTCITVYKVIVSFYICLLKWVDLFNKGNKKSIREREKERETQRERYI